MLELGIIAGIVVLIGLILILIPTRFLNKIFGIFSLGTFGIRYIRRRRDHTDTLANFFLFISLIISFSFFIIPFFQYVVGAWLTFAFLATFGQATHACLDIPAYKAKIALFGIWLMYAAGLIASIGLINNFAIISDIAFFTKGIFGGKALDVFFYLTQPYTFDMLLEALIIFTSCYILWAQFKYLRLENTYKAKWVITYILKILIACSFVLCCSYFGFAFIDKVYQIGEANV